MVARSVQLAPSSAAGTFSKFPRRFVRQQLVCAFKQLLRNAIPKSLARSLWGAKILSRH